MSTSDFSEKDGTFVIRISPMRDYQNNHRCDRVRVCERTALVVRLALEENARLLVAIPVRARVWVGCEGKVPVNVRVGGRIEANRKQVRRGYTGKEAELHV